MERENKTDLSLY